MDTVPVNSAGEQNTTAHTDLPRAILKVQSEDTAKKRDLSQLEARRIAGKNLMVAACLTYVISTSVTH
eukprot:1160002-Pelagomonas_calceolata.AAC.6